MHRTDLKGVKIGSSASKTHKVCVIGSLEIDMYIYSGLLRVSHSINNQIVGCLMIMVIIFMCLTVCYRTNVHVCQ